MALVDAVRQIGTPAGAADAHGAGHQAAGRAAGASPRCDVPRPCSTYPGCRSTTRSPPAATSRPARSLAEIKEVQRAHGVTLNDVVLAVVGGALRRWLGARASSPSGPWWPACPSPPTSPARRRGWAATGSRTCSPRWPPTSTTRASGCSPSPARRGSPRSSSARWGRTCSSTGCSSPRRLRSARPCGSTPARGPRRGTRRRSTWSSPTSAGPADPVDDLRRARCATCSASGRSSRGSGSTSRPGPTCDRMNFSLLELPRPGGRPRSAGGGASPGTRGAAYDERCDSMKTAARPTRR